MSRKILSIVLMFMLLFIVSACNQMNNTNSSNTPDNQTTTSEQPSTNQETEGNQSDRKIPETIVWSTYPVGSAAYVQTVGFADGLAKSEYDIRLRNIPTSNDVARLQTLTTEAADLGVWGGASMFFLQKGLGDFATREYGPQAMRAVWNVKPSISITMVTTEKGGIKSPYDLKGKRVPHTPGNPSGNIAIETYLAFGNLTWDDVEKVDFPGIIQSYDGLISGQVDVVAATPTATKIIDLSTTPQGVYFPEFPVSDKEGWERINKVAPFMISNKFEPGLGSQEGALELVGFPYPILAGLNGLDEDLAYVMTKVIHETYGNYKDIHPDLADWELENSISADNMILPFYEGSVEYLKDIGIWNDEMEARQQALLAEEERIMSLWADALAKAEGKSDEELAEIWEGMITSN